MLQVHHSRCHCLVLFFNNVAICLFEHTGYRQMSLSTFQRTRILQISNLRLKNITNCLCVRFQQYFCRQFWGKKQGFVDIRRYNGVTMNSRFVFLWQGESLGCGQHHEWPSPGGYRNTTLVFVRNSLQHLLSLKPGYPGDFGNRIL